MRKLLSFVLLQTGLAPRQFLQELPPLQEFARVAPALFVEVAEMNKFSCVCISLRFGDCPIPRDAQLRIANGVDAATLRLVTLSAARGHLPLWAPAIPVQTI